MSNRDIRPTLAQLRTFVTIAENRHFGTAATKLGISQPSLSQALASLEAGLGLQLIERSTRRVIVTPAGRDLLPYAVAALEAADAFSVKARGNSDALGGGITLGMIPTIAPYLLPELLHELQDCYPTVVPSIVEAQTSQLVDMLRDGAIDVALLALPVDAPHTNHMPLYRERFYVATPEDHPLAGRTDVSVSELTKENLLLLADGHCLAGQVVSLCATARDDHDPQTFCASRLASLTTLMQCVEAHMGITLIPASAVNTEGQRPGIATASIDPLDQAERLVGLLYRTSSVREAHYAELGAVITRAYCRVVGHSDDPQSVAVGDPELRAHALGGHSPHPAEQPSPTTPME